MSTGGPYSANGPSTTTLKPPFLQLKPPPKRKSKPTTFFKIKKTRAYEILKSSLSAGSN